MESIATFQDVLSQAALFHGIARENYGALLDCLEARTAAYRKGETILEAGVPARAVGILLSGAAQLVRDDIAGDRHILSALEPSDVFGESYAAAETEELPFAVVATHDVKALFIPYARITKGCANACSFHTRLIQNLMGILAQKNIQLNQKLEHLSKRTTREKLLSYLMEQARRQGGRYFRVPFNRQELADYLMVDRSALSNELSKLRAEGVLEYYKSEFKLLM